MDYSQTLNLTTIVTLQIQVPKTKKQKTLLATDAITVRRRTLNKRHTKTYKILTIPIYMNINKKLTEKHERKGERFMDMRRDS